jgi:hypothetical protein
MALIDTLRKLFTRNIIVTHSGGVLKVFDVSKAQSAGGKTAKSNYHKWQGSGFTSGYSQNSTAYDVEAARLRMYTDYELMDTDAIIASALDIYADSATVKDANGQLLTIHTQNVKIKKILYNLFYDVLNIDFNLWAWTRELCKFGDYFLYLQIQEKYGIVNVIPIHPSLITREENYDPERTGEFRFKYAGIDQTSLPSDTFEQYEMAHFRMLSDSKFQPYGRCLCADSHVDTEYGTKSIDEIVVGDMVWTFDIERRDYELAEVINVCESGEKSIVKVRTNYNTIRCSPDHKILIYNKEKDEYEYKEASKLQIGEFIESDVYSNEYIVGVFNDDMDLTYDIQVSKNSNFIANGIVVHNSSIEPARKEYKKLSLFEDAMLLQRIMRAPERRIFKVDIGNIAPEEVDGYMKDFINMMKKVPYIDQATGDYNLKFNLQNMLEDYYLPVRGSDSGTSIDTLSGLGSENYTQDVEYSKSKLLAALKIPKAWLGYDESIDGKANTAGLDIRFASTIERVQKVITSELYKMAIIHLLAQGIDKEKIMDFELVLSNSSTIRKRQEIDVLNEKMNLATNMLESKLFSRQYIYERVFDLSPDEWNGESEQVLEDLKLGFRYKQIEDEGNDPKISKVSVGTPHDIAAMQMTSAATGAAVKRLYTQDEQDTRSENEGRPPKEGSFGRDKDPSFGRDPVGMKALANTQSNEGVSMKSGVELYIDKILNAKSRSMERPKRQPTDDISMLNESSLLPDSDT